MPHLIDSKLRDKRIFIIEDNVANRAIMQLILEQHRAQIGFERWGTQSSERLLAFAPVDVILLDLMFPAGVSGFDIFDTIRALPDFGQVPIIAVSASEPSVSIPKARAKGFSGFIPKPINIDLFPQQIVQVLEEGQVWDFG